MFALLDENGGNKGIYYVQNIAKSLNITLPVGMDRLQVRASRYRYEDGDVEFEAGISVPGIYDPSNSDLYTMVTEVYNEARDPGLLGAIRSLTRRGFDKLTGRDTDGTTRRQFERRLTGMRPEDRKNLLLKAAVAVKERYKHLNTSSLEELETLIKNGFFIRNRGKDKEHEDGGDRLFITKTSRIPREAIS